MASWCGRSLDGVYAGLLIELTDLSSRLVAETFLGGLDADELNF